MIYIEILSSSDPLAVGLYEFEYDHIHLGRSKKNDLIFLDKELPLHYITLQIIEGISESNLVVRSLTRSPFFFVNGKKISGVLKVRVNDVIAFGENRIKIIYFKKTSDEADFQDAFINFEKNRPELRFALNFIEEVLVDLEEKNPNV